MDELVQWLGEQLDEDEQTARKATARQIDGGAWLYDVDRVRARSGLGVTARVVPVHGEHIARHDPARVLREIDAKRRLLAAYTEVAENDINEVEYAHGWANALGLAVRHAAAGYSDRPGYKESWRP